MGASSPWVAGCHAPCSRSCCCGRTRSCRAISWSGPRGRAAGERRQGAARACIAATPWLRRRPLETTGGWSPTAAATDVCWAPGLSPAAMWTPDRRGRSLLPAGMFRSGTRRALSGAVELVARRRSADFQDHAFAARGRSRARRASVLAACGSQLRIQQPLWLLRKAPGQLERLGHDPPTASVSGARPVMIFSGQDGEAEALAAHRLGRGGRWSSRAGHCSLQSYLRQLHEVILAQDGALPRDRPRPGDCDAPRRPHDWMVQRRGDVH